MALSTSYIVGFTIATSFAGTHASNIPSYYMKHSISYRGSIVWNLLEPSVVSARDYAKRAKKCHALRNLNFNEESPQMGRRQIDSDFVFY